MTLFLLVELFYFSMSLLPLLVLESLLLEEFLPSLGFKLIDDVHLVESSLLAGFLFGTLYNFSLKFSGYRIRDSLVHSTLIVSFSIFVVILERVINSLVILVMIIYHR